MVVNKGRGGTRAVDAYHLNNAGKFNTLSSSLSSSSDQNGRIRKEWARTMVPMTYDKISAGS